MLDNLFKNKNRLMKAFFLAPLKIFLWSGLFSMGIFVAMSIFAIKGDFTVGTSFVDWYQSVSGIEPVNGMFPADNFNGCWSCGIFAKVFDLMSVVGLEVFTFISDIVWTLVLFGIAIWMLSKVYSYIKDEQKINFNDVIKELAKKLFIIAIIGVAIGYSTPSRLKSMANLIFENTALPVLEMGVGVGTEIVKSPVCEHLTYPQSEVDGILSKELKNDLLCLVNSVNVVYLSATTAGANMIDFSLKGFLEYKNPVILLDIIGGMAITVIFFLMYLVIPFTLIDIVFTIGILIAFVPVMLAGYAYDETKKFSSTGFKSLFGMAFKIIMYCIFLGIIYSSFIFIGDMYYPGPLDNFTYLFPDFIYNDLVASQTDTLMKSEAFANCFNLANGNVSKIQSCLVSKDILFEMPSLQNPGGSFFPIFTLGLLSLMIMGNLDTYSGIVSGYMFKVGGTFLKLVNSTRTWVKSFGREITTKLLKKDTSDIIKKFEALREDANDLDEQIKDNT